MALIRNFPVPSDRMAIISTLLNIEDAVVLEYGPEGTTHFSMNFFNKLGQDYPDRLFTTGVDDSDIIMGSTEHLERGILELDTLYSPKAIFVLTSSVTSIIGTDIAGICDSLQNKVQSRLIPVNTSGLGADYSAGLRKIYLQLLKDIRHCLVMADEDTVAQADMTNFKVCVSHPCYSHRTIAKHLPFMGERGADMLFEYIQQYVNM